MKRTKKREFNFINPSEKTKTRNNKWPIILIGMKELIKENGELYQEAVEIIPLVRLSDGTIGNYDIIEYERYVSFDKIRKNMRKIFDAFIDAKIKGLFLGSDDEPESQKGFWLIEPTDVFTFDYKVKEEYLPKELDDSLVYYRYILDDNHYTSKDHGVGLLKDRFTELTAEYLRYITGVESRKKKIANQFESRELYGIILEPWEYKHGMRVRRCNDLIEYNKIIIDNKLRKYLLDLTEETDGDMSITSRVTMMRLRDIYRVYLKFFRWIKHHPNADRDDRVNVFFELSMDHGIFPDPRRYKKYDIEDKMIHEDYLKRIVGHVTSKTYEELTKIHEDLRMKLYTEVKEKY